MKSKKKNTVKSSVEFLIITIFLFSTFSFPNTVHLRAHLIVFLLSQIIILPACNDTNTALMKAVRKGDTATVKALLDKGADVNAKNKRGWTSFMWASSKGNIDTVQILINKGADVNAKDDNDRTALMFAVLNKHKDVVEALVKYGAGVNLKNKHGKTALNLATEKGYT